MLAQFTIPGRLPSLNQSFRVGKWRFKQSRERQKQKRAIATWILAAGVPVSSVPVDIKVRWVEPNRRRDYDNIASGVKVILDALVACQRIPNDTRKWVYPVVHEHDVDPRNPRIEVTICEHVS